MLEHAHTDPYVMPQQIAQSSTLPAPSQSLPEWEAQIEDYLDQASAPLIGIVPHAERLQRRAEMRAELDALIVAHQELGSGLEEATHAAIRQLGHPSTDVHIRSHAAKKRLSERLPSARPATLLALGLFGCFYIADATKSAWQIWTHLVSGGSEFAFYRFELFAVPLLVGLATGLLARHRAGRGVLNALALLAIPAILLPGFLMGLDAAGLITSNASYWSWVPSPFPGIAGVTFWAALGYAGAQFGSWLHRKAGN